jgi:MtN3 and saliva related transmembrane protein
MSPADIIGSVAAILTTSSFLPQAAHVLRTRDTRAISLTMYAMFTVGITLVMAMLILGMKLRDVMHAIGARQGAGSGE